MPSYVTTKWGKRWHIQARSFWPAMTLCGRRVDMSPKRLSADDPDCTRCLRAARMSKREE